VTFGAAQLLLQLQDLHVRRSSMPQHIKHLQLGDMATGTASDQQIRVDGDQLRERPPQI
jgi:hypothetical protein